MTKKNYGILFIIISIFASYYAINPLDPKPILERSQFTLDAKGMSTHLRPPILKPLSKHSNLSQFFIHPSSTIQAKGTFTFHNDFLLQLTFFIGKGSPCGDIEFMLRKNGKEVKRFIVTTMMKKNIKLSVEKNDKIEIIADQHGNAAGDWGNFYIYSINELVHIENFLIPLLWSLLFVFLLARGHNYTTIITYIAFLSMLFAEKLNFGLMSFEIIGIYTLFYFSLTLSLTLIYQEFIFAKKLKFSTILSFFILLIVYAIPFFFIIHVFNAGEKITSDILFAIFQTNSDESLEYISDTVAMKYIVLLGIFTLSIAMLLYHQERKEIQKIKRLVLFPIIIMFLVLVSMSFSHLRLPEFIIEHYNEYKYEIQKFTNMQNRRKNGLIDFNATKEEENETYVVVIGESLNKHHMGLYGYQRNNTPLLTEQLKNDLLVFDNTYANYLSTMESLSFALTEANQYNNKKYFDSLSIINILNEAKFETFWITNQVFLGSHDNLVAVLGKDADHPIPLNHNHGGQAVRAFDGRSIDVLKNILKEKTSKNRVIFIHLMGSHVRYTLRYPHEKFSKYDTLNEIEYGKFCKNKLINVYDNGVYYNDYVVANLLNTLQKEKGVSGFLYFSDHGEEVLRHMKHNSSHPIPEMYQIPMISWLSEGYKNRYPKSYATLKSNQDTLFSNDLICTTLLGLMNVKTERYNSKYDLTSSNYQLKPSDALSMHGRVHYADNKNYIYWRNINSQYLSEINQTNRVVPDHINLIGKFNEIRRNNFKSFGIDVYIDDKNGSILHIGTQKKFIQATVKDYLEKLSFSSIDKIYINLSNIQKNNLDNVLIELEKLNIQYGLKKRVILIFDTPKIDISIAIKKGWKFSFKLNDEKVQNFINTKQKQELAVYMNEVGQWQQQNKIMSLTLSEKNYSLLKSYFDSSVYKNFTYNIITIPKLKNKKFINNFKSSSIYKDDRIKTIFVDYPSIYEI